MLVSSAAGLMLATLFAVPQTDAKDLNQDETDVAKLQSSIQELESTRGYRYSTKVTIGYELVGTQQSPAIAVGTQPILQRSAEEPTSIEFDGEFARSQPLHLKGEHVESYRLGERVVFQDEADLWQLQATPAALPEYLKKDNPRSFELWAASMVPAPHELLQQVDCKNATFQRSVEDRGILSSDDLVYTTQLEGRAIPAICRSVLGKADQMVCSLRIITNKKGALQGIELQGTRESLLNKNASVRELPDMAGMLQHDLTIHYALDDLGDELKLEIPQAVQLLLKR